MSKYRKFNNCIEVKLDRLTLPKDGQKISFQTTDENWHSGEFCEGDDYFVVSSKEWYMAYDILSWCDEKDVEIKTIELPNK